LPDDNPSDAPIREPDPMPDPLSNQDPSVGASHVPFEQHAVDPLAEIPLEADDEPAAQPIPHLRPTTPSPRPSVQAADPVIARPLVTSPRVDWPLIVAGLAAILFIAACIAGQRGLFPAYGEEPVVPDWATRLLQLARGLLMMPLAAVCLAGGAWLFQLVERRPLGDVRGLSARMLMIACVALIVRILPIDMAFLKQSYDVLAPVAAAWLLLMAVFRLTPRDAGVLLGAALLCMVLLGFGSTIVSFALWTGSTAGGTSP